MKVKLSDLRLALENIPTGTEVVEMDIETNLYSELKVTFIKEKHTTKITIYDSTVSITPEITQTSKIYKKV